MTKQKEIHKITGIRERSFCYITQLFLSGVATASVVAREETKRFLKDNHFDMVLIGGSIGTTLTIICHNKWRGSTPPSCEKAIVVKELLYDYKNFPV